MGKGYEKKYKVTRISLADYQFVKQFSIGAGVSMSEALHQLIIREKPKAEPVSPAQIHMPVTMAESMPVTTAYGVKIPVAIRVRLQPTIATNGSKIATDRIKLGGVRYA